MPEYVSTAPYGLNYTEGRDLQGRNLGLVQPGDIRDLDEPPDQWWREATDEDRAAQAAREAGSAAAGEPEGDEQDQGAGDGDGEPGSGGEAPEPSAPVPAPPAVITGE